MESEWQREQEYEAGEACHSVQKQQPREGPRGALGAKANVIGKEAPDASIFVCISNAFEKPLQYVNT